MLRTRLWQAPSWLYRSTCMLCAARGQPQSSQLRLWRPPSSLLQAPFQPVRLASSRKASAPKRAEKADKKANKEAAAKGETATEEITNKKADKKTKKAGKELAAEKIAGDGEAGEGTEAIAAGEANASVRKVPGRKKRDEDESAAGETNRSIRKVRRSNKRDEDESPAGEAKGSKRRLRGSQKTDQEGAMTLKEAMLGRETRRRRKTDQDREKLDITILHPRSLKFEPVNNPIPPVPMLSYGLDRVLFNPGVYLLQDPRSRLYNFDPYLEKIMPVNEFDFSALSEYKTSSKDEELLKLTKNVGALFTGSTSSMSSVLQHFHFLLSNFRPLNHSMLSREFPDPSAKFSKITLAPSAVFLRYKDGIYAIDADKSYDTPNIMSWLGHSLEKLLTSDRAEFERFRRSSSEKPPTDDKSDRCYHYSKQGNLLMRSQLDALDPRLPGSGVFDLKTRAVVSIRMDHQKYELGSGYQIRQARGEWESFEREFYDMTRATMLKYSLQVRMGRMDGIFVAFHNIERIFGFQYLPLPDLDAVLHGQHDTSLGDDEFRLSLALLDELLARAIAQYPNTSIRLHVEARDLKTKFMYIFAEPVTEERADEIQAKGAAAQEEFARNVVGVGKDDPEVQAAWQELQDEVDEQVDEDKSGEESVEEQDNHEDEEMSEEIESAEDQVDHEEPGSVRQKQTDNSLNPETEDASEDIENFAEGAAGVETTLPADAAPASDIDVEYLSEDLDTLDKTAKDRDTPGVSGDDPESATQSSEVEVIVGDKAMLESIQVPRGPLIGWTLTVRSKVNGGYVHRPEKYTEQDDWELEYHIQEIPEEIRWKLFDGVIKRRHQLLDKDREVEERLQLYRQFIHEYSNRGREWRLEQDKLDEAKPVQVYKPLGPGSGAEFLESDDLHKQSSAPPSPEGPRKSEE